MLSILHSEHKYKLLSAEKILWWFKAKVISLSPELAQVTKSRFDTSIFLVFCNPQLNGECSRGEKGFHYSVFCPAV